MRKALTFWRRKRGENYLWGEGVGGKERSILGEKEGRSLVDEKRPSSKTLSLRRGEKKNRLRRREVVIS